MVSISTVFFQSPWGTARFAVKKSGKLCSGNGTRGKKERKAHCMGKRHSQSTYGHKKSSGQSNWRDRTSARSIPAILLYSLVKTPPGRGCKVTPGKGWEQIIYEKWVLSFTWMSNTHFLLLSLLFPVLDGEEYYTRLCPLFSEKFQPSAVFQ